MSKARVNISRKKQHWCVKGASFVASAVHTSQKLNKIMLFRIGLNMTLGFIESGLSWILLSFFHRFERRIHRTVDATVLPVKRRRQHQQGQRRHPGQHRQQSFGGPASIFDRPTAVWEARTVLRRRFRRRQPSVGLRRRLDRRWSDVRVLVDDDANSCRLQRRVWHG